MSNSTSTLNSVDLANYLAKLICNPNDIRGIAAPAWKDGSVYLTNEHIGVKIRCEKPNERWVTDNKKWVDLLDGLATESGDPVSLTIPGFKHWDCWKDPFKKSSATCPECNGFGEVVCNYGHEHECPECEGSGVISSDWIDEYYDTPQEKTQLELPGIGYYDRRYLWIIQETQKHRTLSFSSIPDAHNSSKLLFSSDDVKGILMGIAKRG